MPGRRKGQSKGLRELFLNIIILQKSFEKL